MDVSIIIVNWNTRDILRDCLKSIYSHLTNIGMEVIVVDNASDDGSCQMVKLEFPYAKLVENDSNTGYAAAANQGIRVAAGRYVLIINSDIIFVDAIVDKIVKYADDHTEAAVVTCQVWQSSQSIQMTCFRLPSILNLLLLGSGLASAFKYNWFLGREHMYWWNRDSEREVDVASGMFMLVRRTAFEKVGLMDESFFLYYEETDWCRRFVRDGWKILFWPGVKVLHLDGGGHSSPGKDVEMFALKQQSRLLYFRKHHGSFACMSARLILIVSFGMRLCAWNIVMFIKYISRKNIAALKEECRKCRSVLKVCLSTIDA